jgi:hypothetical protein
LSHFDPAPGPWTSKDYLCWYCSKFQKRKARDAEEKKNESKRREINIKKCSTQWAWGAGRLRSPERASDKLGKSRFFFAGTALDSKSEKWKRCRKPC